MTSVSASPVILTPTRPVGSKRPQRVSNPGLPDKESRILPTELPRPLMDESVFFFFVSPQKSVLTDNSVWVGKAVKGAYDIKNTGSNTATLLIIFYLVPCTLFPSNT